MSVAAATLTMAKTCIGGGVLALPYAHLQGGVLAVPAMCLFGLWNWTTCHQLVDAYETLIGSKAPRTHTGYSAIAFAALGNGGILLLDTMLCMLLTGVCASIQVQAAHLVEAHVDLPVGDGYAVLVLMSGTLLVPLVLLRNLGRLAVVSVVALVVLATGLLAVAMSGVTRFGMASPPAQLVALPDLSGIATFYSIAAFSFGMQVNLLPIRDGMREPRRALEAASLAVVVVACANSVVGVGLAWLYAGGGRVVEEIILLNLPPHSPISLCVEVSTAIVALLGYPLLMLPVMQVIPARLPPEMRGNGLRLSFLACTTMLALLLRQFALVAALCGCLSIFVCLVLPPLCHLRLCTWPPVDSPASTRRPLAAGLDAATLVVGACAFAYFTADALRSAVR